MALTSEVKDELARIEITKKANRIAELATILRFTGGLHIIGGRIVIEVELDSSQIARRVSKDLAERGDIRLCIVDEASAYKDARTKRHRLARLIVGKRPALWLMTGTPTPTPRPMPMDCRNS